MLFESWIGDRDDRSQLERVEGRLNRRKKKGKKTLDKKHSSYRVLFPKENTTSIFSGIGKEIKYPIIRVTSSFVAQMKTQEQFVGIFPAPCFSSFFHFIPFHSISFSFPPCTIIRFKRDEKLPPLPFPSAMVGHIPNSSEYS